MTTEQVTTVRVFFVIFSQPRSYLATSALSSWPRLLCTVDPTCSEQLAAPALDRGPHLLEPILELFFALVRAARPA